MLNGVASRTGCRLVRVTSTERGEDLAAVNPGNQRFDAEQTNLQYDHVVPAGGIDVGDDELLRRCREGEAEAWRLLVERYQRLVFSVAMRNGLTREDAADVTQTTFMALLDSIDQIRGVDRLSSWLMTVARRQAWRLRRRAAQEQRLLAPVQPVESLVDEWEQRSGCMPAWPHSARPAEICWKRCILIRPSPPTRKSRRG